MTGTDPWEGPASFCDLAKATKDLNTTTRLIWDMVDEVATAKVVKEMHSERMKQALSKAIVKSGIDTISKAEVAARIDDSYLKQVEDLSMDLLVAEKALSKNAALHARQEGLRSLISAQKYTLKDL